MLFYTGDSIEEKLRILSDAAKYDVACTSSGVSRGGREGMIGNSAACGICHSFSADGRCISLLKVLYTNECIHDCRYCLNRASNDVPRASFEPDELADLTIRFYKRNYIEGLFLSSGVKISPDYTMEQMNTTLKLLRNEYRFNGYIHCKIIPGADPYLVEEAGWLADRISCNLELPTADGLKELAPGKTRKKILTPIRQVQHGIAQSRLELGMKGGNRSAYYYTQKKVRERQERISAASASVEKRLNDIEGTSGGMVKGPAGIEGTSESAANKPAGIAGKQENAAELSMSDDRDLAKKSQGLLLKSNTIGQGRGFAAAGQSTQMIIGATNESDYQILRVTEGLYRNFDLKRVFFSAFINLGTDSRLPVLPGGPPLLREHRLYQADFLMRYYGFESTELLNEKRPNFDDRIDPKCFWALENLDRFPVEVTSADYLTLLRVPGIGPTSARRIVSMRRSCRLDFDVLKKMGVVLKRAVYFITCNGKMQYSLELRRESILDGLTAADSRNRFKITDKTVYRQLNLFDDFKIAN